MTWRPAWQRSSWRHRRARRRSSGPPVPASTSPLVRQRSHRADSDGAGGSRWWTLGSSVWLTTRLPGAGWSPPKAGLGARLSKRVAERPRDVAAGSRSAAREADHRGRRTAASRRARTVRVGRPGRERDGLLAGPDSRHAGSPEGAPREDSIDPRRRSGSGRGRMAGQPQPWVFPDDQVEVLAEGEHRRWMHFQLATGGPRTSAIGPAPTSPKARRNTTARPSGRSRAR